MIIVQQIPRILSTSCQSSFKRLLIYHNSKVNKNMSSLSNVPVVDIDPSGVFKYILINVYEEVKSGQEPKMTIARGYKRCNYHSDIYDEVQAKLSPLDCEPLGGGRISHDPENKKIHIYGYSQGYGKADHEITAKLIKAAFPEYTITISDEGRLT
ncbi:14 kDa phosphohistidine phosphatase-like isoform X2 [Pieris brassicae]|uniref:14 kDa phosphohistidine phosphatase-like isoform X2 n=1 Tax=Pieris brassicae TaxID=7116 RepID=UPI001E6610F7|nr:14 kDa phosphohistidine phosphatase-like isoform X2 [Pieris brassicae]